MSIDKATEAMILRYFHAEKWKVGTIARELGIHRSCVDRVISQAGLPKAARATRPSLIDDYLALIVQTLEQYPKLCASRLYQMVCERGYSGGPDHFRHLIAHYRPRAQSEAYLRLKTLPGEQAQVDWGHFGHLDIGRARRALMAFVMVLSYSRAIFLRFYLDARMGSFLHGHVSAFEAFGGVARVLLYDNLKSAVLERCGQAIRFHPTLLALAAHYRFEPRPVAIARGNEKGRVERAIRYVRDNFFAGRVFTDLADLNAQAQAWCQGPAAQRRWAQDRSLSVAEAFAAEQPKLLALPDDRFAVAERVEVKVGKTPYVRFDLNDYSVTHQHVRCTLSVLAEPERIRIIDGQTLIAEHPRCYDKAQQIETPEHLDALAKAKRAARIHRGIDQLSAAVPNAQRLLEQAAEAGNPLRGLTRTLIELLESYGGAELELAIEETLARGVAHPNAVRLVLERRREARELRTPIVSALPDKARSVQVRPHSLDGYDQLNDEQSDEQN